MGAFKSEDGGAVAGFGTGGVALSTSSNGKVSLIAAATNTKGVTLHLGRLVIAAGSPTCDVDVYDAGGTKVTGGKLLSSLAGSPSIERLLGEIFIPPDHEIAFDMSSGAQIYLYMRWTIHS